MTVHVEAPSQVIQARPARELLAWARELVDPGLREAVDTLPPAMRRMAGYHFGWWEADGTPSRADAGKAFRPALALLAAEAVGGIPVVALPAAVAVELVHNFTLIQDDVMDGDRTRRHRPTVWSRFGTGQAIVAGDALLTLAYDLLAGTRHPAARQAARMLSAAVLDVLEGQQADLDFERRTEVSLDECLSMAEGKSGALLGAAVALGAAFAGGGPEQVARLRSFGEQLGLAFQLADDLLGIWGDPAVTGKPVHSDLRQRKKSLPLVAALTSSTPAGAELAGLYHGDRPLSEAEVRRTAELVDRAGGRRWCQARADGLLTEALRHLYAVAGDRRAAAELTGLAQLAVYRDR
jgi:geranylgeranyl diphosphate synthase type I